jgi:hypothetical protein
MSKEITGGPESAGPPALPGPGATSVERDIWVGLGLGVTAISAASSSFDGLRNLAQAAGWSLYMSPLFALCVDAYALTAIRVWLKKSSSPTAAAFARRNAVGAVLLSLVGNSCWHLVAAGLMPMSWWLVMAVGAVAPVVLGLVTHLAILRRQPEPGVAVVVDVSSEEIVSSEARPEDEPHRPAARSKNRKVRSELELLEAARQADASHRHEHGRAITRDELRAVLQVAGPRATELLRILRQEQQAP